MNEVSRCAEAKSAPAAAPLPAGFRSCSALLPLAALFRRGLFLRRFLGLGFSLFLRRGLLGFFRFGRRSRLACGRSSGLFFFRIVLDDDLFHFYDFSLRNLRTFFLFLFVTGQLVVFFIMQLGVKHQIPPWVPALPNSIRPLRAYKRSAGSLSSDKG